MARDKTGEAVRDQLVGSRVRKLGFCAAAGGRQENCSG